MELTNKRNFSFLAEAFTFPGPVKEITSLGSGHIHDTYLIICTDALESRFVLQKFNHRVFKNPQQVASNIWIVFNHFLKSSSGSGLQPLQMIRTRSGALLHQTTDGDYWRVFNYIEESDSFDQVYHPDQAYGAASAFGSFIELLNGLDPQKLFTTIPDFHNLTLRFQQLTGAIYADKANRVNQFRQEVEFALARESSVDQYTSLANGLPLRVTHNDTKINNVLFKRGTTQAICVIDLDTVMPGFLLYDFGDMARTFCNSVLEEEDAEGAMFRMNIFESLCQGFFTSIKTPLSRIEMDSLKAGPWWMTFIMGIRFLADFLSGDIYYKISNPLQNLQRARNQFRLLTDIERKQEEINKIIDSHIKSPYS